MKTWLIACFACGGLFLGAAELANPSIVAKRKIAEQTVVLHDGTFWTIVPRNALIWVPRLQRARVGVKPVGTLLPWGEFLAENSAWLMTHTVSFDEAAGNTAVTVEAPEANKDAKVVVAVHQGLPAAVTLVPAPAGLTKRE